jgi:peptidoglycan/LPS O-acetylase OafA/YrhL
VSAAAPATPAPAEARPEQGARRITELEAFRGLAAVFLVVYHAYQDSRITSAYLYEGTWAHPILRNLEAGVALFFVLSGLVIFLPWARAALERRDEVSARGFLIRRAIRIIPAYFVAILIVWTSRYNGTGDQWQELWQHLTFTQVFDREHIFFTIGPAWSLAVEVQFYVFIALLGPLLYRAGKGLGRGGRLALLWGTVAVLFAISVAWKLHAFYVAETPEESYPTYFGPLAKLDEFALGMGLAVLLVALGDRRPSKRVVAPLLVTALALTVLAFTQRFESDFVGLMFHTIASLAALALIAAAALPGGAGRFSSVLRNRTLQWMGLISYSVYLWHEPVLLQLESWGLADFQDDGTFLISTLGLMAASLLVGWLSYNLIERPAQELRHMFTREGRFTEPRY